MRRYAPHKSRRFIQQVFYQKHCLVLPVFSSGRARENGIYDKFLGRTRFFYKILLNLRRMSRMSFNDFFIRHNLRRIGGLTRQSTENMSNNQDIDLRRWSWGLREISRVQMGTRGITFIRAPKKYFGYYRYPTEIILL